MTKKKKDEEQQKPDVILSAQTVQRIKEEGAALDAMEKAQPVPELSAEPVTPTLKAGQAVALVEAHKERMAGGDPQPNAEEAQEKLLGELLAVLRSAAKEQAGDETPLGVLRRLVEESKVDGPVYQAGRIEGHADVAAMLRERLGPRFEKVNLAGLLAGVGHLASSDENATLRTLIGPQGHCRGLIIRAQGNGFVLVQVEAGEGRVSATPVKFLAPDPVTGKKVTTTVGHWHEVRDWFLRLFSTWVTPTGFR